MSLDKMQKLMINTAVSKLAKWMKEKKGGRLCLSIDEINKWLKENGYNFKVGQYVGGLSLECKDERS